MAGQVPNNRRRTPTTSGFSLLETMVSLRQHLMVVADEQKKTIGLVTLEDVIEEMLGHEIDNE